jgi:hypothetical protein
MVEVVPLTDRAAGGSVVHIQLIGVLIDITKR